MHKEIDELEIEFNNVMGEQGKFFFMSAGKEFQVEACNKLSDVLTKTSQIKEQRIAASDEGCANLLLSIECTLQAFISELKMWISLKEDDPNKAWDYLIDSQEWASSALCAHEIANQFNEKFERLEVLEKVLFRHQMFTSLRVTIGRVQCSICNEEYGDCDHLIGKPYMGRLCHEVVTEIKGGLAFDFVEDPYNKRSRAVRVQIGEVWRDYMTWRIIPDKLSQKD